jgi:peptidoglycan/xylan/chitin deacetylase (PgdA/CDA1 family)
MKLMPRRELRAIAYYLLRAVTDISSVFPSKGAKVPILVYHRVCPLYYKKEITYANVYPEEFEKQMAYLRDHCEVITVSEYLERKSSNGLTGRELCITFDDGFKDNYLYAFPVLKKYRLRATFFLTTGYIGRDTLFPWMPLDRGAKEDLIRFRVRWLPLSWEEVKEMMEWGMEFGTHTHTHRDSLSKMTAGEAEQEIDESTRRFREKTGIAPKLFSYPHGTFKDYGPSHIRVLKAFQYSAGLTTNIGRNDRSQSPYELKRIIVYEADSLREFKKKVTGAYDIAEGLQKLWLSVAGARPYSAPQEIIHYKGKK